MTGRGDPRNDRKEWLSERSFSRCHCERLTPVSFRTPYSRVIPNALLPCHSERSEESAVWNSAGDGAKLEEIPRRCAPRNDKGWLRSSE
jgi:hypothetical protein